MKLNPFERIEAVNLLNNDEALESKDESTEEGTETENESENQGKHEAPADSGGVSLEERRALVK